MQYIPAQSGLTLPELLLSLLISTILMSMAAPSMRTLVGSQRIASVTQDIYGSFVLARSEAVKRRRPVSLCASSNGASCDETGNDWSVGWLVFTDTDQNGLFESGESLIKVFSPVPDSVSMTWNQGAYAGYNSKGYSRRAGTFSLCEQSTIEQARQVIVSLTGRVRVTEPDSC